MKKLFYCGSLVLLTALASCDQKDGYSVTTNPIYAPAISIITNLNDQSVLVSEGYYFFNLETRMEGGVVTNTGTVSAPSNLIMDNVSLEFVTKTQDYDSTGYDAFFGNAQGTTAGSVSYQLNNADFEILYRYDASYNAYNGYYYTTADVGDYTYQFGRNPYEAIAKFYIGADYRVNTFQKETLFRGTTTTSYTFMGQAATNQTDAISYRFIINTEDNTATAIMYDAKFSSVEQEPTKTIVVEGLDVAFTAEGVNISGQNIIPSMYIELEGFVPMNDYIFNDFYFHTTDQYYISGELDFQVGGIYNGHFEGSYIKNSFLK